MEYQKDRFGTYEVTFSYLEPTNNKHYEMRKYINSKKIKTLGGMYAIYCEEDQNILFRKSEYLRDRSYSAFVEGRLSSNVYECGNDEIKGITSQVVDGFISSDYEKKGIHLINQYLEKEKNLYSLPSYIDKTKLTEEEFQTLRKIIKKGLVTD